LDDVRRGPDTRLNTRAFEESQYFLDFKTSFGVVFRASDVTLGLHFPGDFRSRPRTVLSLEVNADGSLGDARVHISSGYAALDRDALDAARRVFPFDPPPRKLLTSRDTLRFGFEIIY
jgi:TonB family protein